MADLTAGSTIEEIENAYLYGATYEEDSSSEKCRSFMSACRIILLKFPNSKTSGGESVAFDRRLVAEQLEAARRWINSRTNQTNRVRFFSLEDYRS